MASESSPNGSSSSIREASASLLSMLDARSKELDERERDLNRRQRQLDLAFGDTKSSDVLLLNVGGRTDIAVTRRTLTCIEGSMLEAKFSGRWDDNLEKDEDGRIFIDQDPDLFLQLLTYLRAKNNTAFPESPPPTCPPVSRSLDLMLGYYGLQRGVYPYELKCLTVFDDVEDLADYQISNFPEFNVSSTSYRAFEMGAVGHSRKVSCFTVKVGVCSKLGIGWRSGTPMSQEPEDMLNLLDFHDCVAIDLKNFKKYDGSGNDESLDIFDCPSGTTIQVKRESQSQQACSSWRIGEAAHVVAVETNDYLMDNPCLWVQGDVQVTEIHFFQA